MLPVLIPTPLARAITAGAPFIVIVLWTGGVTTVPTCAICRSAIDWRSVVDSGAFVGCTTSTTRAVRSGDCTAPSAPGTETGVHCAGYRTVTPCGPFV